MCRVSNGPVPNWVVPDIPTPGGRVAGRGLYWLYEYVPKLPPQHESADCCRVDAHEGKTTSGIAQIVICDKSSHKVLYTCA